MAIAGSERSFTFVVLGDNRGDASGAVSPAFQEIVEAVREKAPRFVLNTGDMIYGHTNAVTARQQWQLYLDAVSRLRVPVHHVPGNHDIWNEESSSLYRDFCGPTYWSFTNGSALFIGLDTETRENSLGSDQFVWLKRQLADAGQRSVFVMLHRPLFPVDGAVGSSLDANPHERDELHRLFVQYRHVIKAVFLGHEHLYHFQERDGVRYHITGGAGANLYVAPELGGFHHFLLVHVTRDDVKIELKRVGALPNRLGKPLKIRAGASLESWEQELLWYPWDYTVTAEITSSRASDGNRGLQLNFDAAQCPWPVLSLPLEWVPDWNRASAFLIDVYLPATPRTDFTITPALESTRKLAAPVIHLRPGWNTVRTSLDEDWLPERERPAVRSIEWGLTSAGNQGKRSVVFDNLRYELLGANPPAKPKLLESWERALLWRVTDESVVATPEEKFATNGRRGLKVSFDFARCREPIVLARLNPPWDLREPAALALDIYLPEKLPAEVRASIGLRKSEVTHVSPALPLVQGWNKVRAKLGENWLPREVRAAAEQVECRLSTNGKELSGWVVLDNLRTESP